MSIRGRIIARVAAELERLGWHLIPPLASLPFLKREGDGYACARCGKSDEIRNYTHVPCTKTVVGWRRGGKLAIVQGLSDHWYEAEFAERWDCGHCLTAHRLPEGIEIDWEGQASREYHTPKRRELRDNERDCYNARCGRDA